MALVSIGETARAEPLFEQMVAATQEDAGRLHAHALFGLGLVLAYGLSGFAGLAAGRGDLEGAVRLLAASTRALQVVGVAVWPGMQDSLARLTCTAAAGMGSADFDAAYAEGARMPIPEAFRYALGALGGRE